MRDHFEIGARITGGTLDLDRAVLRSALRRFADGDYVLTLERPKQTRTLEANRDYWGYYVTPLAEHTGYTKNEMHAYLKKRFLPAHQPRTTTLVLCDRDGVVIDETVVDVGTTTTLTEQEMDDYKLAIAVFAGELGVVTGKQAVKDQRKREAA